MKDHQNKSDIPVLTLRQVINSIKTNGDYFIGDFDKLRIGIFKEANKIFFVIYSNLNGIALGLRLHPISVHTNLAEIYFYNKNGIENTLYFPENSGLSINISNPYLNLIERLNSSQSNFMIKGNEYYFEPKNSHFQLLPKHWIEKNSGPITVNIGEAIYWNIFLGNPSGSNDKHVNIEFFQKTHGIFGNYALFSFHFDPRNGILEDSLSDIIFGKHILKKQITGKRLKVADFLYL